MCGIFALLNNEVFHPIHKQSFMKGQSRGPENSILKQVSIYTIFGFHRLAINGLNEASNQPIQIDNISLICNGEIYNYKELYELMGIPEEERQTQSDCEIIIHLYKSYGIEQTLQMIDGVFAFVLCDSRIIDDNLEYYTYVARDPFGVRPLYYSHDANSTNKEYLFASEMKMFPDPEKREIKHFTPGTYSSFILPTKINSKWKCIRNSIPYYIPPPTVSHNYQVKESLFEDFYMAIQKRCITTERPIACLLSGGLDSSSVASIVTCVMKKYSTTPIETYSIGLEGSNDLYYANKVAKFICSKHTEVIVTEDEMFDAIPEVIHAIESYDTTTVRASIGNYLLGKYIKQHSEAKVIFNGDGADELFGGYLYMKRCPDAIEYDKETRRLLKDIHMFDVLRSDKSISSHGLEPRTPFLDKNFVNKYLALPLHMKYKPELQEKYMLREIATMFLPDEVRKRRKEAFSDGVSGGERSFYQVVQERISQLPEYKDMIIPAIEKEKLYYKNIFLSSYPNQLGIIPYYWMPKYTESGETSDPSARTLSVYSTDSTTV
jgi:asparagine synthase (glutamine-hydrolysing)